MPLGQGGNREPQRIRELGVAALVGWVVGTGALEEPLGSAFVGTGPGGLSATAGASVAERTTFAAPDASPLAIGAAVSDLLLGAPSLGGIGLSQPATASAAAHSIFTVSEYLTRPL